MKKQYLIKSNFVFKKNTSSMNITIETECIRVMNSRKLHVMDQCSFCESNAFTFLRVSN